MNWESEESRVLINPAYSKDAKTEYSRIIEQKNDWPGHIWLATSGSTVQKWVGLSKKAILTSALAVNEHLKSDRTDRWALALPLFHAGGLGILARSYLSGAALDNFRQEHGEKWNAQVFYDFLIEKESTLTSLVPAQLFDLVKLKKPAPSSLRAVIIGGGQLLPELYAKAVQLGWKVLPSYGLTECASQVATAHLNHPQLQILPHVKISIQKGCLAFKGSSLLSVYALSDKNGLTFVDPKENGWFISEDRGSIEGNLLTIMGRVNQVIKVGGENVDFSLLESKLQTLRLQLNIENEMTLLDFPDERLGSVIHLVVSGKQEENVERIKSEFDKQVMPFERIRQIHWVMEIPKSALSKVLRHQLLLQLK